MAFILYLRCIKYLVNIILRYYESITSPVQKQGRTKEEMNSASFSCKLCVPTYSNSLAGVLNLESMLSTLTYLP